MQRGVKRFNSWPSVLLLFALLIRPDAASAVRAIPWVPGRPIVVRLEVGRTTEIVFPTGIVTLTPPGRPELSYDYTNRRIVVKPKASFEPARMFVTDSEGKAYILELQEAAEGSNADDSVDVVPELPSEGPPPIGIQPNRQVIELFRAMKQGRPLPGFEILDGEGKIFREEIGVVRMRTMKQYDSSFLLGHVLEIENISSIEMRVDPQQFIVKGLIAASVKDMFLAPREPETSIEAFKGYPKKTTGYLVISKEAANR